MIKIYIPLWLTRLFRSKVTAELEERAKFSGTASTQKEYLGGFIKIQRTVVLPGVKE
jgi:hypothetical protein